MHFTPMVIYFVGSVHLTTTMLFNQANTLNEALPIFILIQFNVSVREMALMCCRSSRASLLTHAKVAIVSREITL
jgi:hypothetical protein